MIYNSIADLFCYTLFIFLHSNDSIYIVVINMELDNKRIGIRIMQRRKEMGLNQEQFSELIGYSKNHISSIERGIYVPTTLFIFKTCEILGGTPDYYLIGKISKETDDIVKLLRQLPDNTQKIIYQLLLTYMSETNKN